MSTFRLLPCSPSFKTKLIILLFLFLTIDAFQPSQFTLSQLNNYFQAPNDVELLATFSNIRSVGSCAIDCYRLMSCRTFDYDSTSHQCRLFEGSIDTGVLRPTSSESVVGSINMNASMFNLYNAPSNQCIDNRFLRSNSVSGRCECPIHTFWDGSMCLNQRFDGDVCVNNTWCRTDLSINCVALICVGPTTTFMTTTQATSTPASTAYAPTTETPSTMLQPVTSVITSTTTTTTVATCTTFITFDDIQGQSSTSGPIPNGYQNLNWTNADYINASTTPLNSGYRNNVLSLPFVAYSPTGDNITITTANGTRFSFDSIYLSSAWRNSLNVTMNTIRSGWITSSGTFRLMVSYSLYVYCPFCTDIDTMTFQAQGGIPNSTMAQNGT